MPKRLSMLLAALALAPSLVAAPASPPAYALQNARIVSMSGPVIESGTLVMRDGRIAAVGADVHTPADAIAIDASGWTLYPGFIDAHSSLGMPKPKQESAREAAERRERGDPTPGLQANVRASTLYAHECDALDAYRRMGVTVAAIAPQHGILRGQSVVIALGDGRLDDAELVLSEPWAQHIGYEPFSRDRNDYPGTLMGVLATIRQSFSDANWYQIAWERYAQTPDALERPPFDESLVALGAAANNEQQVVFSAWSDNAIVRTLGLAHELADVIDHRSPSILRALAGLDERFAPWTVPDASPSPMKYGDVQGPALERSGDIAIVGGRVVTVAGPTIEGGTVLIRNGRIAAVGTDLDVPSTAEVIDARGLVVTPGIINAGTTLGISEIGAVAATQDVRELQEINASVKAAVAVHPHSEMLPVTRANGVTTAITAPAGGLISGQAALIDMAGWTAPEVVAKKTDRKTLRDWMRRSQAYAGAIANGHAKAYEDTEDDEDELCALVPVVRGELPVLLHAESEEGIRAALDFADEFGLDTILVGTRDVWRTVDAIAAAGVPVILGPLESRPAPGDPYDAVVTAASLLQDAGVAFCFRTGGATNARNLPYTAGMAVAFGLSREQAWHAMRKSAADILGVGDDYGSIEVGKVANVVVSDGDLLDVPTQVRHVLIRGRRVDLSSRHTKLYQKFKARPLPVTRGTDANP